MTSRPGSPTAPRRLAAPAAVAVLAATCSWIGLAALPGSTARIGPATIELQVNPSWHGRTELQVAPLGSASADTHDSPLSLRARIVDMDLRTATRDLSSPETDLLTDDLAEVASTTLTRAAIRHAALSAAAMLACGLLVGAVVPRRSRRTLVAGVTGSAVAATVCLGATAATFNPDEVHNIRYTGALAQMPALLETLRSDTTSVLPRLQALAGQLEDAYQLQALAPDGSSRPVPAAAGTVSILHVSDIHSNPLGVAFTRNLATTFGVDAVLDTGDLTSFGVPGETALIAGIGDIVNDLNIPYLFVAGNHDANGLRTQIAATGVRVLNHDVAVVGDGDHAVTIFGVSDPTFTADNTLSGEDAEQIKRRRAPAAAKALRSSGASVFAVHDPVLATHAAGVADVVIAGHVHRRGNKVQDGTRFLTVGSSGAEGLAAKADRTKARFEAQLLHFTAGKLIALDYLTLQGVGGHFSLDRQLLTLDGITAPDRPAEQPAESSPAPSTSPPASAPASPAASAAPARAVSGPVAPAARTPVAGPPVRHAATGRQLP